MEKGLKSIAETARELNVTTAQLRYWDKQELITSIKENSGRYFHESEFEKIILIRDLFEEARKAGFKRTYDDIRRELAAANMLMEKEENETLTQQEKVLSVAFERVLKEQGFDQAFQLIAGELNKIVNTNQQLQSEVNELKRSMNQMTLRLDAPKEEEKQLREELDQTNQTLKEVAAALEAREKEEASGKKTYEEETKKAQEALETYKKEQEEMKKKLEEMTKKEEEREARLKEEESQRQQAEESLKKAQEEQEEKQAKRGFFAKLFGG